MFNRILDHLEEWLIAFLMGAATFVIFLAVLHRFLSGVPYIQDYTIRLDVSWAQELCIYMFVWMAKFGAAYGVRQGTHVGVDVVVRKLPKDKARWLILFGLLAGALFTIVVGTLGARFVWENGAHYAFYHRFGWDVGDLPEGPTTPDLEVPTWIVYSCVPLGSYLMCFRFLQVAWHFLRTGEIPHHDPGHVEGLDEAPVDANTVSPGFREERA
ncbi:TRAP transporter small permease [Ramlibacter aquaticus]|uniref:TRAP transporter small permease protein n=1 Tax=Ramlibacter aquaticus TaxID=2780094 RepID=A0ABR9SKE1_9BURK|nr:TRAP transporter small permease [Ramlibacter aquaticus]MBE7942798.1 TRAP transporter small permease [Ramlibacter aquaticus]